MTMIGVRELRQQTSEVLRKLKEEGAEYIITYQGQPVALLLPLDEAVVAQAVVQAGKRSLPQAWRTYEQIAARARDAWPAETETQALLDEYPRIGRCSRLTPVSISMP